MNEDFEIDGVEVHPLFVGETAKPLKEPIAWINVHRVKKDGDQPCIAVLPAEQLPDEMALLERFGPGTYHLVGRNISRGGILRRVNVQVDHDGPVGEATIPAPPPLPGTAAPPSTSAGPSELAVVLQQLQAANERALERLEHAHERSLEQARAHAADTKATFQGIVQVITTSFEKVAQVTAASKGGGIDPEKLLAIVSEARERGHEDAIAAAAVARENAGDDGTDKILGTFLQGVMAAKNGGATASES